MIHVSEKPTYGDWEPIQIGESVSIIDAKYVAFNPATFKEEVLESDAIHFRNGTLLSKETISYTMYYCVKLHSSHEIISFQEEPRKYFFKQEKMKPKN